jgi:hypothetical protein
MKKSRVRPVAPSEESTRRRAEIALMAGEVQESPD